MAIQKATLTIEDESGKSVTVELTSVSLHLDYGIARHWVDGLRHAARNGWMDIKLHGYAAGTDDSRQHERVGSAASARPHTI